MKRCSQCQTSPRDENGPRFVRSGASVQVRCGCELHTGWYATEAEAQKAWKDDANVSGWKF